jgi:two-component system, LuxR family, response regulator FixJ
MNGNGQQQVYIVDDDRNVRLALEAVLSARGYQVQTYVSAVYFLASCDTGRESCVLADVRMPGMDGLELQEEIQRRGIPASTVIITGHADVPLAVRAIKAGAVDILEKPFDKQRLLDLLPRAFAAARQKLIVVQAAKRAQAKLVKLSQRETEVAELVRQGLSNKLIASRLAISSRTVELHRSHAMDKLGISTVAELIQMLLDAGATVAGHGRQ